MTSADVSQSTSGARPGFFERMRTKRGSDTAAPTSSTSTPEMPDVLEPDAARKRERFIPVTRYALLERLSQPLAWPAGQANDARRFFRYLDYWRQQQYNSQLLDLEQTYEPFSPDSDLLMTRQFTASEKRTLRQRLVAGVESLLVRANYERIDPHDLKLILTKDSHYGLDLFVDMDAFDEVLIYYRGASNKRHERRNYKKFMRKEEFDVPIFQRLFVLFKLKPFEERVADIMAGEKIDREKAEKRVKKLRSHMPAGVNENHVYLKLFKNIPRTDIEMVFPNTQVKFRMFDKLRLGVTTGGSLAMGGVGAAGKMALLFTNPIGAVVALGGLGSIAFRQAMGFVNQKQKYMVVMAQNLYFHALADNRGVILKIASRAAEEDVKEEMLLYSVLAKEKARRSDLPAIDRAIEQYLLRTFGTNVDFDLEDALDRLVRDGLVRESADGTLNTLGPAEAARHIDAKWDQFLDQLPDPASAEVFEFSGGRMGSGI